MLIFLYKIAKFIFSHWETIFAIFTTTGLGTLFHRIFKQKAEIKTAQIIANAQPENVQAIKEVKRKKQQSSNIFNFVLLFVLILIGIYTINLIDNMILTASKDMKENLQWLQLFIPITAFLLILIKVCSSTQKFTDIIGSAKDFKQFFKK